MSKWSAIVGSFFVCLVASIMLSGHARAEVTGVESVMNGLITQQQINQTQKPQFSGRNGASESIDPVTGSLAWKTDVIHLPGKDGLDLNIGILFQSNQAFSHLQYYGTSANVKKYNYLISRYDLGAGWSFRFPSVQMEEGYTYYHNGEGSVYRVDFNAAGAAENFTHLLGYQGKDIHFEKDTQGIFSNTQESSSYYLEYASKKREYFAADGRLLGIADRYGNNIIFKYQDRQVYDGKTYKVISSITDTVGRTISFTYVDSPLLTHHPDFKGDTIEVKVSDSSGNQGQWVTLNKGRSELIVNGSVDGYAPILSFIDNHVLPKTSFLYYLDSARFDYNKKSYDTSSSEKKYFTLNTVVYPGSKTVFQYEKVNRNLGATGTNEEFRVKSRYDQIMQSGYKGDYNHSNYTYSGDYTGYPTHTDSNNIPDTYQFSSISTVQSTSKTNGLIVTSLFNGKGQPLSTEIKSANGEKKLTNNKAFHPTFKYLPTSVEYAEYAAGDTDSTANKLYVSKQYTDTGALQSATKPLTQAQMNDSSVKSKHTTSYTYEPGFGQLLSTSWYQNQNDVTPLTETYAYNSKGLMKSFTNANGEATTYCYDTLDASGTVISDCTDANAALTNKVQKVTESKNLGNGKTARAVTSYSSDTGYAYPSEVSTTFSTLDDNGQAITQTVRNTMTYYMTSGLLKDTTDGNNNKTTTAYDALGRIKRIDYPAFTNLDGEKYEASDMYEYISNATTASYDAENANITGFVVRSVRQYKQLSNQAVTHLNHTFDYYDGLGNLRTSEFYISGTYQKGTQYHYDDLSRATYAVDATSNVTTAAFDEWGRQNEGIDAYGNLYAVEYKLKDRRTVNYFVEAANIPTYRSNPAGNAVKSSYLEQDADQWGRVVTNRTYIDWPSQAQPLTETYTYDLQGNVLTYTDPKKNLNANGVTKLYSYDKLNRLTALKDALGQQTNYTYDAMGNMLQMSMQSTASASPVVLNTRQYNEMGGLVQKTDPAVMSQSYRYDQLGRLRKHVDRNGIMYTQQYDEQSRNTISTVSQNTNTHESKLNVGSNGIMFDTASTYQNGVQTGSMQTEIDELKRVKSIQAQSANYTSNISLTYDLNSRITQVANTMSGFHVNYQYDKQRLDKVQVDGLSTANTADAANVKYAYYANGRVKSITFPALAGGAILQTSYTYDTFQRVKTVTNTKGAAVLSSYSYDYDNNGNIIAVVETTSQGTQTSTYTYDGLNRLLSITGANGLSVTYAYDLKGNRQTQRDTRLQNNSTQVRQNTFDLLNRLTSVQNSNGTTSFAYAPNELRYKKTNGTQTVQYQYNRNGEVISETNGNNAVTANYVRGDRLLVKQDKTTGKSYYYLYNGHGDVVQIVDTDGNVVNEYQYDVWGTVTPTREGITNSFKYAGEMYDSETGLYYLRARYYDPEVGRFINEDSYEGQIDNPLTLNLYTYVHNNPLIYSDPTGHWCTATVNGTYYAHSGGCNDGANGQQRFEGSGYSPDSVHNGEYEYDGNGRGRQYFVPGAPHISDPTGISQAVIGCAFDSQCAGFVTMGISSAPKVVSGVSSGFSKAWNWIKGLFSGGSIKGFDATETAIIKEARNILSSKQFSQIGNAAASGESITVNVGGRIIQYEPGLPASGMTMFGENGFLIGREAFVSEAELAKTVLHELHRLTTSASSGGVSASLAAQETQAAFNFAERAFGVLFK